MMLVMKSALICLTMWICASVVLADENNRDEQQIQQDWLAKLYLTGAYGYAKGNSTASKLDERLAEQSLGMTVASFDNSRMAWQLALGYQLVERFALEFGYTDLAEVTMDGEGSAVDTPAFFDIYKKIHPESGKGWTGAGVLNFLLSDRWRLRGKLGLFKWRGAFDVFHGEVEKGTDNNKGTDLFGGLGIEYVLNNHWRARAEWQRFKFTEYASNFYALGLSYDFGRKNKPQPVIIEVTDNDGDGVLDRHDQCPNTRTGIAVDEVGCDKDSDGDGVADSMDQCLVTQLGIAVDALGCDKDIDGDGVADTKDQCSNTQPGIAVDNLGCDKDTDNDRVADSNDQCPHTLAGVAVDAIGCDKDIDSDGVANADDQCQGTPNGVVVDDRGCEKSRFRDRDGDGVVDTEDHCMNTVVGRMVDARGCEIVAKVSINIHFETDSALIQPGHHGELKITADFLKAHPEVLALIEGHTDAAGGVIYNQGLSERRAQAVRQYLINRFNIDPDRLSTVGFGKFKPIGDNSSPIGRRKNRRVIMFATEGN